MEATITIEYSDAETANAIAKAVSPDNFKTPSKLFIKTEAKGNYVLTEIETEAKLATFIATVDDLLFCISTAEKTIHATRKALLRPK